MVVTRWRRRRLADEGTRGGGDRGSVLETLPSSLLIGEILSKLDVESLCSLSCTSTSLYASCSQSLNSVITLDLSDVALDKRILSCIQRRCGPVFSSLTLNCLRLDDQAVKRFIGPNLRELHLLKGSLLTPQVISFISNLCPNLRVLTLEFAHFDSYFMFTKLPLLTKLEHLCLKCRRGSEYPKFFNQIRQFLPENIQILKLRGLFEQGAHHLLSPSNVKGGSRLTSTLQNLSLALNVISDALITKITSYLPQLPVLELEDLPCGDPGVTSDLTDLGLQKLGSMRCLKRLSLVRTRHFQRPVSFSRVTDMGMLILSEGCRDLESVRLAAFNKVSDAGFASFLHCCPKLKSYEVRGALHLSDLTLHDLSNAPCSLLELRLLSCDLITSETVKKLVSSSSLEVLDLRSCRSVSDSSFHAILSLSKLTTLCLTGCYITDDGLATLGKSSSQISRLSLRACTRVTDKGISMLLHGEGKLRGTLTALDLGYLPDISDKAIYEISTSATAITELCIRSCVSVGISSLEALVKKRSLRSGVRPIQKLDLSCCDGLSFQLHLVLGKTSFRGLRWLGIGGISWLGGNRMSFLHAIFEARPWLTVCTVGCEIGCHDGWHLHGKSVTCNSMSFCQLWR